MLGSGPRSRRLCARQHGDVPWLLSLATAVAARAELMGESVSGLTNRTQKAIV
jgi:hypothetical protein